MCMAVLCYAVLCCAVQCSAVRCGAVRCGAVRCGAVRCGAVRCGAVRCGALRCRAVPCRAACAVPCGRGSGLGRGLDRGGPWPCYTTPCRAVLHHTTRGCRGEGANPCRRAHLRAPLRKDAAIGALAPRARRCAGARAGHPDLGRGPTVGSHTLDSVCRRRAGCAAALMDATHRSSRRTSKLRAPDPRPRRARARAAEGARLSRRLASVPASCRSEHRPVALDLSMFLSIDIFTKRFAVLSFSSVFISHPFPQPPVGATALRAAPGGALAAGSRRRRAGDALGHM